MNWTSLRAVVAGVLAVIVVTTLVDIALHVAGVFPRMDQPLNDALALLATTYRIVIGIGAAWLTAWLAPARPMKHAMVLGYIGVVFALVLLAVPQSWIGARLYEARI